MAQHGVLCVRLPPMLDTAVRTRAELDGLSPSEVMRAIVHAWVHGEQPSVEEGYMAARSQALNIAHALVDMASDELPEDIEELPAFLEQMHARAAHVSAGGKQRKTARVASRRRG